MAENFRPRAVIAPTRSKVLFYGRMLLDLQLLSIYRDLRKLSAGFKGKLLDVGCGNSPFRFLLGNETKYYGIDIGDAGKFDYQNPEVIAFNGRDIPYPDNEFDNLICTEVLEHVQDYQGLINEMHRTMKPGATGFFTIPWSARYHYVPFDYFRYTPSALVQMFSVFSEVKIVPRSSDVATVGNKLVVLWYRNVAPGENMKLLPALFWFALSPLVILALLAAHVDLLKKLGSSDDPLGYTIIAKK